MIKNFIYTTLLVFLCGCASTGESPSIAISSVSINGEMQGGYTYRSDKTIELEEGDELELTLLLNGNGGDLQAFSMAFNEGALNAELIYDNNTISKEGNLSDPTNGHLRFMDGVTKTEVLVMSTIETVSEDDEEIVISFYLSSNSVNEGVRKVVTLKSDK